FYSPTVLNINPLDDDIYVLDDTIIYRIKPLFNRIEIVLGKPYFCSSNQNLTILHNPIDFTFDSYGDLYVLETSRTKQSFIRVLKSNGIIETISGYSQVPIIKQFQIDKDNIFSKPSSIIAHPDGTILLANSGSKEIFKIKMISSYDDEQKNLNIFSPETNEIYLFNRMGQHHTTIDALTDYIYNFTYDSPQNAYARLDSITHRSGKSVAIKYDYAMKINDIYLPSGNKLK
ncbi:unnamed protein product, partial [Didymodactylos carnosus]